MIFFPILIALLVAAPVHAQEEPSLFDTIFEETEHITNAAVPTGGMLTFIIEEFRDHWGAQGIMLTKEDITAAVEGNLSKLCNDKADRNGDTIEFVVGSDSSEEGSCIGLKSNILSFIESEREASILGSDLLSIANGSELSIADEPHRPVNMAHIALLLRRVWSGTGAGLIPWDEDWNGEVQALEGALKNEETLDKIIMRYRHGYFRQQREDDPVFHGVGDAVGDALQDLAGRLGVNGDEDEVGEFAVPKLKGVENVGFWARKDDIGLFWIYPTRFSYPEILPGGQYPKRVLDGETLGYPFTYKGSNPEASELSPLCTRTIGRQGYLCRPQPDPEVNCGPPANPDAISLIKCSEKVTENPVGPAICKDLKNIFRDTGVPLTDPNNPGKLNPALVAADTAKLCSPETKVLYQDDITSHACYIGHCLSQSMSGHTLVPNRNTTLVSEVPSPYLACVRPDPQLGLYAEATEETPYPLPLYLGHYLVRDFEEQYCSEVGAPPHPVLGFCSFREQKRSVSFDVYPAFQMNTLIGEAFSVKHSQDDIVSLAANAGHRAALTQTMEIHRKVFATLAHFIRQVADLFLELKRAPLTRTPCPWTGPFRLP